jgi:hypothetical protein
VFLELYGIVFELSEIVNFNAMIRTLIFGCFALCLMCSSCIEIIDDITIRNDGSGTLKYTINLSSSKVKIASLLALDSMNGKKVPSLDQIKEKVSAFKFKLEGQLGVSNVMLDPNWPEYIFKLQCDFTSVAALQKALRSVIKEMTEDKTISEKEYDWLVWDGQRLVRSVPEITLEKTKTLKQEEVELLKQGSYTSISRFERLVEKFDNSDAKLSQNKLNVMVKTNPYLLSQNPKLLDNTIYLTGGRN